MCLYFTLEAKIAFISVMRCSLSCLFDDPQNAVLLVYLLTFGLLCLEGVQVNLNWGAELAGYKNAVAESW